MNVPIDEVERIARLARLELSPAELEIQSKNFNELLQRFAVLQSLDLAEVQPTSHPMPLVNIFRDDKVAASLDIDAVVLNSPQAGGEYFVVPRILEA